MPLPLHPSRRFDTIDLHWVSINLQAKKPHICHIGEDQKEVPMRIINLVENT